MDFQDKSFKDFLCLQIAIKLDPYLSQKNVCFFQMGQDFSGKKAYSNGERFRSGAQVAFPCVLR